MPLQMSLFRLLEDLLLLPEFMSKGLIEKIIG